MPSWLAPVGHSPRESRGVRLESLFRVHRPTPASSRRRTHVSTKRLSARQPARRRSAVGPRRPTEWSRRRRARPGEKEPAGRTLSHTPPTSAIDTTTRPHHHTPPPLRAAPVKSARRADSADPTRSTPAHTHSTHAPTRSSTPPSDPPSGPPSLPPSSSPCGTSCVLLESGVRIAFRAEMGENGPIHPHTHTRRTHAPARHSHPIIHSLTPSRTLCRRRDSLPPTAASCRPAGIDQPRRHRRPTPTPGTHRTPHHHPPGGYRLIQARGRVRIA